MYAIRSYYEITTMLGGRGEPVIERQDAASPDAAASPAVFRKARRDAAVFMSTGVESRREYIERHALEATNLDI